MTLRILGFLFLLLVASALRADEAALLGHWPLTGDVRDRSGHGRHGVNRGVALDAEGARFDGRGAVVEIPAEQCPQLGVGDFTLTLRVHTDDGPVGDLVSCFDPVRRRGLSWSVKGGAGTVNSQANFRNVHFGIDAGSEPRWRDVGRPGNAVYVMALAVHDGRLFAGTCEPGKDERGRVYEYSAEGKWVDRGAPDVCNAVSSLLSYDGSLYAGTGKYRLAGSALPESPNAHLGGNVFRYDGAGKWVACGRLGAAEAVGALVAFRGRLYGSSLYRPAGFFRYAGGTRWETLPLPANGARVGPLGVYRDALYAGSYDGCAVYRFDGTAWEDLGRLEAQGQTYSFEIHNGALYVATWPNGKVYRLSGEKTWTDVGRLGGELEVMGLAVFNGKLYGGTLPLAEVHRYDGDGRWTATGRLDTTPDVRYRRAWSMAIYKGRLFCGTLPSGRVHALEAGAVVTHDRALDTGWRALAAVRQRDRLKLFLDGKLVAESAPFEEKAFDLSCGQSWKLGAGPHDSLRGRLRDVRLYGRALSGEEIARLAR